MKKHLCLFLALCEITVFPSFGNDQSHDNTEKMPELDDSDILAAEAAKDLEEEDRFLEFANIMIVACNLKEKSNDIYLKELAELRKLDANLAKLISNFWFYKASCFLREFIDKETNDKEKVKDYFRNRVFLMFCTYYYDHWNEITDMIHLKLKEAEEKQKNKSGTNSR